MRFTSSPPQQEVVLTFSGNWMLTMKPATCVCKCASQCYEVLAHPQCHGQPPGLMRIQSHVKMQREAAGVGVFVIRTLQD